MLQKETNQLFIQISTRLRDNNYLPLFSKKKCMLNKMMILKAQFPMNRTNTN